MKVLHMITGLGVGGAELQLRSILQHSRHESDVVTLYNPGPVADMIRADGGRVINLGMKRNTELAALLRLRQLIRDGGYDVVHAHLYRSQVYGRPAAWLARTPVVVSTEHSIGETHLERRRDDRRGAGAVPGHRTPLGRDHRGLADGARPAGEVGRAPGPDDRDPQRGGPGPGQLRPGRPGPGPGRVRDQRRRLRHRGARRAGPEQAVRPGDRGGRATARPPPPSC